MDWDIVKQKNRSTNDLSDLYNQLRKQEGRLSIRFIIDLLKNNGLEQDDPRLKNSFEQANTNEELDE